MFLCGRELAAYAILLEKTLPNNLFLDFSFFCQLQYPKLLSFKNAEVKNKLPSALFLIQNALNKNVYKPSSLKSEREL